MESLTNWCVYMHEHRENGKKYIGITGQKPTKRWQNGYGYRESSLFFNAIERYGWDAFRHEILYTNLTKEEAEALEIALIAKYKTTDRQYGYNLDLGGGGTSSPTEEVRARMSAARKGTHPTPETVERLREAHRGKTQPEEVRRKQSEALKGIKKTPEHAAKIGEAHSKGVVMLDDQENVLEEFPSMFAANEATGVNFRNISAVCNGQRAKAGGYKWKFKTV